MNTKAKIALTGLTAIAIAATGLAVYFSAHTTSTTPTAAVAEKKTFTISGSIKIPNNFAGSIDYVGNQCHGGGGYSDLTPGTAVTVADSTGAIVSTGSLHAGSRADKTTISAAPEIGLKSDQEVVASCTVSFTATDVPEGLPQYVITVSHRGSQVVSAAEAHGEVNFTLK